MMKVRTERLLRCECGRSRRTRSDLEPNQRRESPPADDSSGDSGEEYTQKQKRARAKRRTKGRRDEDEDERAAPRKRKRASKKRVPEEIDLSQYPPEIGACCVAFRRRACEAHELLSVQDEAGHAD